MKISAAILTGGSGSRMNGIHKPELIVGEKSIIKRQLEILNQIFDEILICGKTSESFNNLPVYPDIYQGIGPIAGIYSALMYSKNPYVFILSGDMPFIDRNLIIEMVNFTKSNQEKKYKAIIPYYDQKIEPLHSIYNISLLSKIENNINLKQYSVRKIFENENVFKFFINLPYQPEKVFFNVNLKSEYLKAIEYAKSEF